MLYLFNLIILWIYLIIAAPLCSSKNSISEKVDDSTYDLFIDAN